MSESRDRRDELLREALERPPESRDAFLDDACGGDAELRAAVEARLAAHLRADAETGFIPDAPAMTVDRSPHSPPEGMARARITIPKVCPECSRRYDAEAVVCEQDGTPLVEDPEALVGTTLDGIYRVERLIGQGGFGVVYLARHALLRDLVAIKVLPRHLSSNPDRVERFMREGRAARALQHPNAVVVYDLRVSADNFIYMVQEFVDGRTLRVELDVRGRLSPDETLRLLEPVAGALDEAHARGIVHRDLKPENIMIGNVNGRRVIKLLDLGIAKLFEILSAPDTGSDVTRPGQVIGTPAYMSPEQWGDVPDDGGPEIDGRADVYSLGVVVYEMVSGRKPFEATTANALRRAHIAAPVHPLHEIAPGTPIAFSNAVDRAMAKHRGDRQMTAGELVSDLQEALASSHDATTEIYETPQRSGEVRGATGRPAALLASAPAKRQTWWPWIAGAVALVAVAAIIALLVRPLLFQRPRSTNISMRRLTHTGNALHAALSPDGKYAAAVVSSNGLYQIDLVQVATGAPIRIVEPTKETLGALTFSPDGAFVYFLRQTENRDDYTLFKVTSFGGIPQKIVESTESPVTFSPDGKQIAFVRRFDDTRETALVVANADGSDERLLATRTIPLFYNFDGPAWSPDGATIACSGGDHANGYRGNVVVVDVASGAERALTPLDWFYVDRVDWLDDGSALAISATEEALGSLQLWRVEYPSGERERITNDLDSYVSISASRNGSGAVTVESNQLSGVWVVDLENPSAATQIGSALNRHLGVAWVPGGRVVFSSFETGNAEIWIANVDGSGRKQLTANDAIDRDPVASPDGRWVYFASNRGGAFNIWRVSAEGGDATRITDVADAEYPSITPDGRWICFQELIGGVTAISRVSAEGGASERLSADYCYWPCVSPDGRWIACNLREPGTSRWQAAVIPIDGGEPVERFDVPLLVMPRLQWQRLRWTPDSRAVTFIADNGGHHDVWAQPVDGGERHPITTFRADRIFTYDIARDGAVVLARGPVSSDVVLVTGL